jgi:putative tricarboxylic transport membrane protein
MRKDQTLFSRRHGLAILAGAGLGVALPALSQVSSPKPAANTELARRLRIFIPANAGGGWDQTGRTLGAALVDCGAVGEVTYINEGGKGGTVGLATYVKDFSNDPDTMLISGVVMLGALARQAKPAYDLKDIQPLARLFNDYLLVVVAGNSKIKTMRDLGDRLRKETADTPLAGGSAGGIDHIFAGGLVRVAKGKPEDLNYLPFPGGVEVIEALVSGKAIAGISGYSEFSDDIASGKLRAIGVSSKRAMFGVPAVREFGLDVEMANWRAVMTGKNVPTPRRREMEAALARALAHGTWQKSLMANRWSSAWLPGDDFASFMEIETATTRLMLYLLKLRASA